MSLIEINYHPDRKQLRQFGTIALLASALLSLLLYLLKDLALQWALLIFAVGVLIFIASLVSLKLTRIIYLALIIITAPIGIVVSFTVLAAFYFLLLTPLALFFRLIGRDPLCRKFDPNAETYWLTHQSDIKPERYFHQS